MLPGCRLDFEQAGELISKWGLHGDFETWRAQAVEFIFRPKNVGAVLLVIEHLPLHAKLDSAYLSTLVKLADGDFTEADFARYLQLRRWGKPGSQ